MSNKKASEKKRPNRARFTVATWFIMAAALLGLLAVFILLYDAVHRIQG
jgi:uncharacterized membrane protein